MKKRGSILFILVMIFILNTFVVLANTIEFSSRNNPFSASGQTCAGNPILIDNDLIGVKNFQINNLAGNLCKRASDSKCTSDRNKGCKSGYLIECGNGTVGILNNKSKLIKEYSLALVKNGIILPPGTKSAHVYYKDKSYLDNNGGFKCTFDYTPCNPSCAGKQCGDNGCGFSCTSICNTTNPSCSDSKCVQCITYDDCPRPFMQDCTNNLCVNRTENIRCIKRSDCPNSLLQNCVDGYCVTLMVNTTCKDKDNLLNTSQIIMKLYNKDNSHVSKWDDVNYFEDICYGEFFADTQGYDETSHNCAYDAADPTTPTNVLFWINVTRNSHASITKDDTYNTPICFGVLNCENVLNNGACDEDENAVVKLSSETNAHVARGDSSIAYPIKICCKKSSISGDVSWQDFNGDDVSTVNVGDSVKLVLKRDELKNRNVEYNIYKKNGATFLWFFKSDKQIAQLSSVGFTTWKAIGDGEYYFTANVEGYAQNYSSGNLEVLPEEDNTVPQITIIKPLENSSFIVKADGYTNNISFEQISWDDDDLLNIHWNFNDGNTAVFTDCNNGIKNCNTTHRYTSAFAGTRIINATAKEATRKGFEYDLSRIYVYREGLTLFIIIDSPNYRIRSFDPGPMLLNATSSHVANCSRTLDICHASSGGKICSEITDSINPSDKLYCYKYVYSSSNKFRFTWYVDGRTNPSFPTNASPFFITFPQGGQHDIGLDISVNLSIQ